MLRILFVVASLLLPIKAYAGLFSINISSTASIDPSIVPLFDDAIDFWESAIIGTQEDIDIVLNINASTPTIDGVGTILGQAGNTSASYIDRFLYATQGLMRFDIADLSTMSQSTLLDVLIHEMAHVIGFGTLWNSDRYPVSGFQNVYTNGSGEYTGAYALQIYQEQFDSNATFIPIELDGGPGTANSHWDEGFINDPGELLTGYLDANTFVSDISLASFADIGYVVRLSDGRIIGNVAEPYIGALFALAMALSFYSRERLKKAE